MLDLPRRIPLTGDTLEGPWWAQINYLSSGEATLRITAAGTTETISLDPGLGTTFVSLPGSYDEIVFQPVEGGASVCIDSLAVGDLVPPTSSTPEVP